MEAVTNEALRKYEEEFDTTSYMSFYGTETEEEQFFLKHLYNAFESGKVHGDRILDFSCGPFAHRLGLASKYCKQLTYSEFSSQNREVIQNWLDSKTSETNQKKHFQYIANMEGFKNVDEGSKEIEARTKSKTTGVIKCDILSSSSTLTPAQALFDIVYCSAVLEAICLNDNYVPAVKNLKNLLKPGGFIICNGYTGADFYMIGNVRFPAFKYSSDFAKNSFEEAGLEILDMHILTPSKSADFSNATSNFVLIAQKP